LDWKLVDTQFCFKKIRKNSFILKVINTQYLVTEPSSSLKLDKKIQLNIHSLATSEQTIIGYEIVCLPFSLILTSKDYLLLGSFNLKKSTYQSIYKDKYLSVFKTKNYNFLFCC
jgi:hypothetical protein